MHKLVPVALTLATGGIGAALFVALGAPAAFLTGSAVATTVAVAAGLPVSLPLTLRQPAFAILGMMMGAGVQPSALDTLGTIPVALIGLGLAVVGATLSSYLVLRRIGRWDPITALCGSIPGALSITLAVAIESGARMDRVVMAQAIRLLILVAVVPLAFGSSDVSAIRVFQPEGAGVHDVILSIAIAVVAAVAGQLMRVPSVAMVAPLLVSAVLSGTGLVTIAIPPWLAALAFVLLGASVGTRFTAMTRHDIVPVLFVSLGAFLAAFVVCISVAAGFSMILGAPLGAVFLAYAPGGVDAMIALAFLLHFDVAFVAILHVTRLLALSICGPLVVGLLERRTTPRASEHVR